MTYLTYANKFFIEKNFVSAKKNYENCLKENMLPRVILEFCESQLDKLDKLDKQSKHNTTKESKILPYKEITINNHKKDLPAISVIIPHFNALGFLVDALKSIDKCGAENIEVIVCDDHSDNQEEIIKEIKLINTKTKTILLLMEKNLGPSSCRNLGLNKAQGRIVYFLDADDMLDAKSISSRFELLNGWYFESAAFSPMEYVDEKANNLQNTILKNQFSVSWPDFISNKFPCSAIAIKKKFLHIDQFNTSLKSGEDYEFFSRLAQRGVVYKECDGSILYRQHKGSLTHKDQISDVEERALVSEIVHSRTIEWSLRYPKNDLMSSIRKSEISKRTFPICCILAMKGKFDQALKLSSKVDLDDILVQRATAIAGSINFFFCRELIIKKDNINSSISKLEKSNVIDFLATIASFRHTRGLTLLVRELFKERCYEDRLTGNIEPKISMVSVENFCHEEITADFVALYSYDEFFDEDFITKAARTIKQQQHAEAFLVPKKVRKGNIYFTIKNSIAPRNPEDSRMKNLGDSLLPGLIIDRTSAIVIQRSLNIIDDRNIDREILKKVFTMRIKAIGGFPELSIYKKASIS